MLKRAAMGKDIKIVTSANLISLIKTFSGPDLKLKPFEIGKDFMTSEGAVFELKCLAKVMQRHHPSRNGGLFIPRCSVRPQSGDPDPEMLPIKKETSINAIDGFLSFLPFA